MDAISLSLLKGTGTLAEAGLIAGAWAHVFVIIIESDVDSAH